jgi:hypothetical protein
MTTTERLAWGLLSFIALIVWCRWRGTPEDQKKDEPPQVPKDSERQAENGRSILTDYLALD